MDDHYNQSAARANAVFYDSLADSEYVDGAPHIKHAALRKLYLELTAQVYDLSARYTTTPRVLDLGAGEGSATLPFLQLGAKVTAVDVSERQLNHLLSKCGQWREHLQVRCQDLAEVLKEEESYDIISAVSLLHHVPDYLSLVTAALRRLNANGQFFAFEDPLRYESLGGLTLTFSRLAYFSWRIFRGDVIGGLKRRVRRGRGAYLDEQSEDSKEYHVIRHGVDQDALAKLFDDNGWECQIVRYFSSQSPIGQSIGTRLGLETQFGLVARRRLSPAAQP